MGTRTVSLAVLLLAPAPGCSAGLRLGTDTEAVRTAAARLSAAPAQSPAQFWNIRAVGWTELPRTIAQPLGEHYALVQIRSARQWQAAQQAGFVGLTGPQPDFRAGHSITPASVVTTVPTMRTTSLTNSPRIRLVSRPSFSTTPSTAKSAVASYRPRPVHTVVNTGST